MRITPIELKLYREENCLTQVQLAERAGCTVRTVKRWEKAGLVASAYSRGEEWCIYSWARDRRELEAQDKGDTVIAVSPQARRKVT